MVTSTTIGSIEYKILIRIGFDQKKDRPWLKLCMIQGSGKFLVKYWGLGMKRATEGSGWF